MRMYWQLYSFTLLSMLTKGLATLAIAGSLLATSAGAAFAKGPEKEHGFPGKGIEMRAEHRDEIEMHKSAGSIPELTQCTFAALDKKDTAAITAHETFDIGMKAALSSRKISITAALAITDATARKAAVKKAQADFKIATKTLNEAMRKAQRATQQTFKTDRKACGEDVKIPAQS